MGKVSSVVDTVLGEALAGDYADMVGIVSVIDNRSKATGVSYQDVVAAPGQFDAFGKSLPAGVGKYRDMARQAIADVKARGPVHTATFYATPAAAKGLPKGLVEEARSGAHTFYSDPKGRAIATTQGYKTPDLSKIAPASRAVAMTPEVGPVPTARPDVATTSLAYAPEAPTAPDDPFGAVMSAPEAPTVEASGMRSAETFSPTAAPSIAEVSQAYSAAPVASRSVTAPAMTGKTRSGFATYGPEVALEDRSLSPVIGLDTYNAGAQRSVTPTTGIVEAVQEAVSKSFGPGFGVGVVSGQEPAGMAPVNSPVNHPPGLAIDFDVVATDPTTGKMSRVDITQPEYSKAVSDMTKSLAAQGHGIGLDPTGRVGGYMNTTGTSPGRVHAGGPGIAWGGIARGPLAEARSRGFVEAPEIGPALGVSREQAMAANVAEQAGIGSFQTAFNDTTPDIGMPDMSGTAATAKSAPGFDQTSFNEMTADIGMPGTGSKGFSQTAFNEMTDDIGMPTAGPSFGAVAETTQQAKEDAIDDGMIDLEDRPMPGQVAPVTAPVAPVAPARTPTPAANVMAAPSGGVRSAPTAPVAATAADVWGGKAEAGRATNGNQVSRNPDGTISMTSSKYGYTDTYAPDGGFRGTTAPGLFGIDAAARSMFGGLGTGKGLSAPGLGKGFSAKGAVAGAKAGAMFGVPGMALGAVLGGFATPVAPTPAQAVRSYQQGYRGGLGFPEAPKGGASSQGGLTAYGEAASRGDFGGQAQTAADNPGTGLF